MGSTADLVLPMCSMLPTDINKAIVTIWLATTKNNLDETIQMRDSSVFYEVPILSIIETTSSFGISQGTANVKRYVPSVQYKYFRPSTSLPFPV